jgi:Protein of unknown function (DUF1524)
MRRYLGFMALIGLMVWVWECTPENSLGHGDACQTYDRESFHYGVDADLDCQYTRAERLIGLSQKPVTYTSSKNCSVDSGKWFDPYSGETFYDAQDLEIDHMVALSEAHQSGAWAWTEEQKTAFGNDTLNLLPVKAALNTDKGDKDPADWMPPTAAYRIDFVRRYVAVKEKYRLAYDPAERDAIHAIDASLTLSKIADEYLCR